MDLILPCANMPPFFTEGALDLASEGEIKKFVNSFRKVKAYHVVDSLPRYCYAMDSTLRCQRISSRLARLVTLERQVHPGYFQFQSQFNDEKKEQERQKIKELMSSAVCMSGDSPELNVYIENHDHNIHGLVLPDDCIKKYKTEDGANAIELVLPKELTDGDRIGIYNIHKCLKMLISNRNDQPIELNPLEGAVFDAVAVPDSGLHWHLSAKYCRDKPAIVNMNPLLIEESTNSGEVFLPPNAVQDIVASTRVNSFKPPVYHFSGDPKDIAELQQGIGKFFVNLNNLPFSFIVMNDCDCHMVAIRLLCIKAGIIIYIHEGLSPAGPQAAAIRSSVIHGIEQAIPQELSRNIICLTTPVPKKGARPFQADYRSCGTIAADVIIDFERTDLNQNLDDWLISIVERDDINSWSLIQQEGDKSYIKDSERKQNNSQIKELSVPLDCMHALLLKHYQGDRSKLVPAQLATIVDQSGRTLNDYYELLCQKDGGPNISPDFWTYTYLPYWEDMIENFQPFTLDMCVSEVNSWLEKYHDFQVPSSDWTMLRNSTMQSVDFVPEVLDLKSKNKNKSFPLAQEPGELNSSTVQHNADQDWQEGVNRAGKYMDSNAGEYSEEFTPSGLVDSLVAKVSAVSENCLPNGARLNTARDALSLVDTQLLVSWDFNTDLSGVKSGAISSEITEPKAEETMDSAGLAQPAENHNTREAVLSPPPFGSYEKGFLTESVALDGQSISFEEPAVTIEAISLDELHEWALQNLVTDNELNLPITIEKEALSEDTQSCSHVFSQLDTVDRQFPHFDKAIFLPGAEDEKILADAVSPNSTITGITRKRTATKCSKASSTLQKKQKFKSSTGSINSANVDRKSIAKTTRKESNRKASKKARENKKIQFEALMSEVSQFTDITPIRDTCTEKAKKRVTLDYVKSIVANKRYANFPVLHKHSIEEIAEHIVKKYSLNKESNGKASKKKDKELNMFQRKVKNAISEQVRRDAQSLFTDELVMLREQHLGPSICKPGINRLFPSKPQV